MKQNIGLTHWVPDQLSENGCRIDSYKAIPLFFSMDATQMKQYIKDNGVYCFDKHCGILNDEITLQLRLGDPFKKGEEYKGDLKPHIFRFKHNNPTSPILEVWGYKETIKKGTFWCNNNKKITKLARLYKK